MSSEESLTSHAYRVFSVSLRCTPSGFHRDGIILCTLHAECGAVSQIVCHRNQPRWVNQETVVSSSTAGGQRDKKTETENESKYVCKNKGGRDPYFLHLWMFVLVKTVLDQSTLSDAFGMIQHTIHCYLLILIFWTSCISGERAVTSATIWKHIIWTMSWFNFIIVMRPVLTWAHFPKHIYNMGNENPKNSTIRVPVGLVLFSQIL